MNKLSQIAILAATAFGLAAPAFAQETRKDEVKEDHATINAQGKDNHEDRAAANRKIAARHHRKVTAAEAARDKADAARHPVVSTTRKDEVKEDRAAIAAQGVHNKEARTAANAKISAEHGKKMSAAEEKADQIEAARRAAAAKANHPAAPAPTQR